MPNVAGYKFPYTDAGVTKAQKLKELERMVRNADDEMFRIQNKAGTNTAAEKKRIMAKKAGMKRQMTAMTKGMKRGPVGNTYA
tara:strand:+ start:146 stop:394 length:249 start_codon:yes stop_codon:yes gene_type:complete